MFLTERDVDQTAPSNLPLVFDDDRCLFNTGLYTRRYETIYGLFEPNTKPGARQRWFLKGFFKETQNAQAVQPPAYPGQIHEQTQKTHLHHG